MEDGNVKISRALLSVHDKTGIVEFARDLAAMEIELVSSGGTAAALEGAGIQVTRVEQVTAAPEMLGGRVKTLHPKIHGAILADRGSSEHMNDVRAREINLIDLVVVNLYPFTETIARPGVTFEEAIEEIDIGGPAMTRAAAKNQAWVGVVTSPAQYEQVTTEIRESDGLSGQTRARLAATAFATTAAYDAAILEWLNRGSGLASEIEISATKKLDLRYGENPHQVGAFYELRSSASNLARLRQLGGKELSYNNIGDLDSAWRLADSFSDPSVVVVKHANACGVAVAATIEEAYRRAHACDPLSAFGGVVALNRPATRELAEELAPVFTEVVVAPEYEAEALDLLLAKKNLRVMSVDGAYQATEVEYRSALGGLLAQGVDELESPESWEVVSEAKPTEQQQRDMEFAWIVCAQTKSNAIVLAKDGQAFGIGAGDQSRVGSVERAAGRAEGRAEGGVCASEAFFPFRDGLDASVAAGARAVVEPGGSVRDDEVIAAANEHGIVLVFTGRRHFRHS